MHARLCVYLSHTHIYTQVHLPSPPLPPSQLQVKLVWYYNNARGLPLKKKFISRMKAYHGSTIVSASLTGLPPMHASFDLPVDFVIHTDCPHYYRFGREGESEEEFSTRLADNLESLILKEGPETVAAFIGEPLMGAGGVIPPPKGYWEKVQVSSGRGGGQGIKRGSDGWGLG